MRKPLNILIINGSAQYNAVCDFCNELQRAFCNFGHLVTILDLTAFPETKNTDLFAKYDMVFSFDVIGIELYNSMKDKPFFWSFLIDPPFYLNERLKQINSEVMISCIDKRHVNYIDRYYPNIPYTCFLPHGGMTGTRPRFIPYNERKYDVVIFSSLQSIIEIESVIASLKKDYDPLISYILESAYLDFTTELNSIITNCLKRAGLDFDDEMFREFLYRIRAVDALRRYYKRKSLIEKLIENGISVDIWGAGWEHLSNSLNDNALFNIHGSVYYEEAKYIISDSRILINDMPPYYEGSHERVFAAMQCGTIVATDRSTFLEECFTDNTNILFYDTNNISALAAKICEILDQTEKAQNIIDNAYTIAGRHTWSMRAESILEISDMIHHFS